MYDLKQKDTVFIEYEDCINCVSYSIIKYLLKNKDYYKGVIDYSKIEGLTDKRLESFSVARVEKNILKELSLKDIDAIDFDTSLFVLKENYNDLYSVDNALYSILCKTLQELLVYNMIERIYIWIPFHDSRVIDSITFLFGRDTSKYVSVIYGPIDECLRDLKVNITSYFVANPALASHLIENDYCETKEITIMEYGYPVKKGKSDMSLLPKFDDSIMDNRLVKLGMLRPLRFTKEHFEGL